MKFNIWIFSKIYRKFQDSLKSGKEQRVLSGIQIYIYDYTSPNFSWNEECSRKIVENIKTHVVFSENYFFKSCAGYEVMWKNIVQPDRAQMTIRSMHIACWIPEPTDTQSEYIILLFHCNSVCTKAPHCYVVPTLPGLFNLWLPVFNLNI